MIRLPKSLIQGFLAMAVVALQACGGGGTPAGIAPSGTALPTTTLPTTTQTTPPPTAPAPPATAPPVNTPPPAAGQVQITGVASFESVTTNANGVGLNYGAITTKPMRGIFIAAVSGTTIVSSATTSDTGAYALNVPVNSNVAISAAALMAKTSGPANWNVGVYDNTDDGSLWTIQSSEFVASAANSTRNITAPLGWNAATLTYNAAQRASGPFAILDTIYTSMQLVTSVAPGTQFPQLAVFWSPNNNTTNGNRAIGEIGTSFFSEINRAAPAAPLRAISVLGKEGVDTDEFDSGVIAHEFGHYLQSAFSQNHSTGGPHSTGNFLDMTLSYGEGWGYAFASLARKNPNNPDTNGPRQTNGFVISTGADPTTNPRASVGWFSESSIQYIIYQFGKDNFAPIWTAFSGPMKSGQDALNTIFSFAAGVRTTAAASTAAPLNALLTSQRIFAGTNADQWGTGETNNGGNPNNIPVHQTITVGGAATPICFNNTTTDNSNNKLGEHRYIRFNNPTAGARTITASFPTGGHDITFLVYQRGAVVGSANSGNLSAETFTGNLDAGEVLIRTIDSKIDTASTTAVDCATIKVN